MTKGIAGRRILVTGASGALGASVAATLVKRGARVASVGRPPEANVDLILPRIDLTDEAATAGAYRSAADALGGLDGLVNAAGGFVWKKVEGDDVSAFDDMHRMNLKTAAVSCQAALPFLRQSRGAIVNVGALGALNPGIGMAAYAASKAGVKVLTESLAAELKDAGVRVNAILPTILDTPANRRNMPDADASSWTTLEAAAQVIIFLLSDESSAMTGASLPLTLRGASDGLA